MDPTPDDVRQQLDRILASDGFANADRMSSFLKFVVDRSLAGQGDQIKEYLIGVEVFGRGDTYDPRLDSIVRVEARRLRSKLDEYYAGAGASDPVVIRMRRGSYVPAFEQRTPSLATEMAGPLPEPVPVPVSSGTAKWVLVMAALLLAVAGMAFASLWSGAKPAPSVTVAVLPFAQYSTDNADALLAARLTDGVTSELARLGKVRVVAHTNAVRFTDRHQPVEDIARVLRADVLVEGTVTKVGSDIQVTARLVSGSRAHKMWVENFAGPVADIPALQRRVATAVSAAAGISPSR